MEFLEGLWQKNVSVRYLDGDSEIGKLVRITPVGVHLQVTPEILKCIPYTSIKLISPVLT